MVSTPEGAQPDIPDDILAEIQNGLVNGNFHRALNLSEEWLRSFTLEERQSADYALAQEGYLYARFFVHRQERISGMPPGSERARAFLAFLSELWELRNENQISSQSDLWLAVQYFLHSQVAEGLAKDFAGQKSYNLNIDEVLQLGTSLIEIEKWKSAEEALAFALNANSKNALTNLLLAHVHYRLGNQAKMCDFLREALFLNPDIMKGYMRFLPSGIFIDLWQHIDREDIEPTIKYRSYALTLEINGVYPHRRKMKLDEYKKLEREFGKLYDEFRGNPTMYDETKPRILHYLSWLVYYAHSLRQFDKVEEYRTIMIDLDPETWRTFQDKNLSS